MDLRILGPLEVHGDAGPVAVQGAKRRGVLALLVVNAGQRLALDEIVDALWGPASVDGAARTVQTYVSQLRRVFQATPIEIVTRHGGYALTAPPEAVDAVRFERGVRAAAELPVADERLRACDEVLALWRGTPLDEFDGEWATTERARLELLRLQVLDVRIGAALDLGRHQELLAELEALVERFALDERFWAHLVLAHYRSGRQADALRAFQRARTVLADQLGIEPGPALADLERRVLDQDPALLAARSEGVAVSDIPSGRPLPSGTVTFLFTDLADSTQLWEDAPDEMQHAVARHDALVRSAVSERGGSVVKSTGDGIMAVFEGATAAVHAALDAQRALLGAEWTLPIRARMGLHTGVASPEDGDYRAAVVNRAARVAQAAHPGQVLVTGATAALLEGIELRDLGEHHLRGLAPIRLVQVLAPGLRDDFPPPAGALVVELPNPPTSFVGREGEITTVRALLGEHRLVTLTGVGGCGKTRLAIEVARGLAREFPDGVRFVDLATVTEDTGVSEAVVDALGLTASSDAVDPLVRLGAFFAQHRILCVLDNCEHVLDASAELVAAVLETGGASRVLATTREMLGIDGEQVYLVPSLEPTTEGMRLFAERAAQARADFTVDDTNRDAVVEICRRLDGVPLALELAAARVAHLAPGQLLARLTDRFRLLTGGRRRVQRHQTLAATLDWSHDLLTADDQRVLRRLGTFPGSFSLEAAEVVVATADVVGSLGSLVGKSLVQLVGDGDPPRYRLLETVRLYAEERLYESGESDECRARHRDWVVAWLESKPVEERWFGDIDLGSVELPNIRSALEWSASNDPPDATARLFASVDWTRSEGWRDARRVANTVIERVDELPPSLAAPLCMMTWWLGTLVRGEPATRGVVFGAEWTGRVIGMEGDAQQRPYVAMAYVGQGRNTTIPALDLRDAALREESVELVERGVELSTQCAPAWEMYCRMNAAMAHIALRRLEAAERHLVAGVEISAGPPYLNLRAALVAYLGLVRVVNGDAHGGLALAREAYGPYALVPYWQHARATAFMVALAAVGDAHGARQALRVYRDANARTDWQLGVESTVLFGGVLAAYREDYDTAALLLAAGARAVYRSVTEPLLYFTSRDKVRDALGAERARSLRAEGQAMPLDEALALALA